MNISSMMKDYIGQLRVRIVDLEARVAKLEAALDRIDAATRTYGGIETEPPYAQEDAQAEDE